MTKDLHLSSGKLADLVNYQPNSIVSRSILKKDTGSMTVFAFDKGEKLSEHTAPFDATIQLVEGTAEIIISGKSNILKKDEFIILPANQPHAVNANEKFKMVLTMIKS
ncbi:MAG: cupin domain-containing protein [Candidatus Marinimicrobia bacterium]|nr:cupin domain-containing protein [Candidatus Neomarinimicrobiota bacterium]